MFDPAETTTGAAQLLGRHHDASKQYRREAGADGQDDEWCDPEEFHALSVVG